MPASSLDYGGVLQALMETTGRMMDRADMNFSVIIEVYGMECLWDSGGEHLYSSRFHPHLQTLQIGTPENLEY